MSENEKDRGERYIPTVRYDSADDAGQKDGELLLGRERIREVAERYRIPLYEDPGVIEALARLDMSATIPLPLYGVIAEVLGFIYRLDHE